MPVDWLDPEELRSSGVPPAEDPYRRGSLLCRSCGYDLRIHKSIPFTDREGDYDLICPTENEARAAYGDR